MKRPGRPRLADGDHSVPVSFCLPSKQYDDLCQQAIRKGMSLPKLIREKIRQANGRDTDFSIKK